MAKLDFGIMDGLDAESGGGSSADLYEQHIAYAQDAERCGYRYYFFIEHQNAFFTCITSPNVYLAALARETSSLRFGPMVYQVPMYHPIRLAQDCAMVDQLSHGRLEFGLGYGPQKHEFDRWKLPFTERREMGIEAMDIVIKAWTEDTVTYEGEYWSFDEALPKPKPYQQPYPPVWLGAHSPTSFDYAAKMNFHVAQNIDVDAQVAEKFAYWRQAWEACGHPGPRPRQLLVRHVHVAPTDEQARAEAEPSMLRGMRGGRQRILAPEERTAVMEEIVRVYQETNDSYDFWIDNGLAVVGSPETVIRRLQEQQAFVGYDVFVGQHHFTGMPNDAVERSMQLFGNEVIPAFA
jgi:alkanesulfonate monooxygenase SsuD/methylene tetrahydromethanopterin reductase-like flavin-dependent oxidoreductase (luciferase family)